MTFTLILFISEYARYTKTEHFGPFTRTIYCNNKSKENLFVQLLSYLQIHLFYPHLQDILIHLDTVINRR